MIYKHKRKLFIHLYILKKLNKLSIKERNILLDKCLNDLENTESNFSTKEKWKELLNFAKTDFNDLKKFLILKNDESELLRHTSVLGTTISENERTEIYNQWKIFQKKWNIHE
jgi:hypothetical protein